MDKAKAIKMLQEADRRLQGCKCGSCVHCVAQTRQILVGVVEWLQGKYDGK